MINNYNKLCLDLGIVMIVPGIHEVPKDQNNSGMLIGEVQQKTPLPKMDTHISIPIKQIIN